MREIYSNHLWTEITIRHENNQWNFSSNYNICRQQVKAHELQPLLNDQKFRSGMWVQKLLPNYMYCWLGNSELVLKLVFQFRTTINQLFPQTIFSILSTPYLVHALAPIECRLLLPPHWLQHFPCKILYFWTPLGGLKEAQDAVYNVTTFLFL